MTRKEAKADLEVFPDSFPYLQTKTDKENIESPNDLSKVHEPVLELAPPFEVHEESTNPPNFSQKLAKPSQPKGKKPTLELAPPFSESPSNSLNVSNHEEQSQPQLQRNRNTAPEPGAYAVRPGGYIRPAGPAASLLPYQQETSNRNIHGGENQGADSLVRSEIQEEPLTEMLPVAAEVVSSDNEEDIEDQVRRYLDDKAVTAEVVSPKHQERRRYIWIGLLLVFAAIVVTVGVAIAQSSNENKTISPTTTTFPSGAPTVAPTTFPSYFPTGTLTPTTPVEWEDLNSDSIADIAQPHRRSRFGESVSLATGGPIPILAVATMRSVQTYQYNESDGKWVPFGQVLFGDGGTSEYETALAVSLSGDGTTLAVGVPALLRDFGDREAFVRVFKYNATTGEWGRSAYDIYLGVLKRSMSEKGPLSISIGSYEGKTVVATGAVYEDEDVAPVRIFELSQEESSWKPVGQPLQRGNPEREFGSAISLSSSGTTLAVCSLEHYDFGGSGRQAGKVHVFKLDVTADLWMDKGSISSNGIGSKCNSVDLSSEGTIVAVGAEKVRVFQEKQSGLWSPMGGSSMISNEEELAVNGFGYSVSISSDGSTLAIGAPSRSNAGDSMRRSGFAQVFQYQNRGDKWLPNGPAIRGSTKNEELGYATSLSKNGSILVVGSPGNSTSSGKVTVLQRR